MPLQQHVFREALHGAPLVAILRGMSPEDTVSAAVTLWQQGVTLVEIPLHSPTSSDAFTATYAAKLTHPGFYLGVGSVRSVDDYMLARDMGADFTVSPGLFEDVCSASLTDNIAHLPGVFTPSEVGHALALGFTTVKLFPASTYGPAGLKALRDPFPDAEIVAVGGVTPTNAADYIHHGAIAVGMGSALSGGTHNIPDMLQTLTQNH